MALSEPLTQTDGPNLESSKSGIHWASILGGAAAAAAVSAILLPLGTALGLSSTSAYTTTGLTTFTAGMAVWLVLMQWLSSGVGGYIAGRLRVKWADTHSDEVFFRDNAHGFLAWAVATLLILALTAGLGFGAVSAGVQAGSAFLSEDEASYYAGSLYRSAAPGAATPLPDINDESARILMHNAESGTVSPGDRAYLTAQVVRHTGLNPAEAEARLNGTLAQMEAVRSKALEMAEAGRKAMIGFDMVLCVSLLIGAFIASVSAALGGRLRDHY